MTTPDEPTPDALSPEGPSTGAPEGGARLRARARVGSPRLRADVAQAVTGVERSLVDVATWERLQALEDATPRFSDSEPAAEEAEAPADDVPIEAPGEAEAEAEAEVADDDADIPLLADTDLLPPPVEPEEPVTGGVPLLTRFQEERPPVDDLPQSVLAGVRTVPATTTQVDEEIEEAERRRRKGKILSWSGVALLLIVAAIWLIPNRDKQDGDKLPAQDATTTSTTESSLLLPDDATTTTVVDTTTTAVTAPEATTPTTKRKSTSGSKSTTTTKPPATTQPTSATTQPPLQNPGPTRTVPTTPPATTPTTQPPATTTTTTGVDLPVDG